MKVSERFTTPPSLPGFQCCYSQKASYKLLTKQCFAAVETALLCLVESKDTKPLAFFFLPTHYYFVELRLYILPKTFFFKLSNCSSPAIFLHSSCLSFIVLTETSPILGSSGFRSISSLSRRWLCCMMWGLGFVEEFSSNNSLLLCILFSCSPLLNGTSPLLDDWSKQKNHPSKSGDCLTLGWLFAAETQLWLESPSTSRLPCRLWPVFLSHALSGWEGGVGKGWVSSMSWRKWLCAVLQCFIW